MLDENGGVIAHHHGGKKASVKVGAPAVEQLEVFVGGVAVFAASRSGRSR
ncbi:hypothetical protein ACQEUX_19265 [Micromonospora sp. CA-259024]